MTSNLIVAVLCPVHCRDLHLNSHVGEVLIFIRDVCWPDPNLNIHDGAIIFDLHLGGQCDIFGLPLCIVRVALLALHLHSQGGTVGGAHSRGCMTWHSNPILQTSSYAMHSQQHSLCGQTRHTFLLLYSGGLRLMHLTSWLWESDSYVLY